MNWFKNLRTVVKLVLAFLTICIAMAILGYVGVSSAGRLDNMIDSLYEREMLGLSAMKEADADIIRIARETNAAIVASDKAEMEQHGRNVEGLFRHLDEELGKAEKTISSDDGKAKMAKIREIVPQYETAIKEVLRFAVVDDDKQAVATLQKAAPIVEEVNRSFEEMGAAKEQMGKSEYDEAEAIYDRERATLIILVGVAVLCSMGLGYFIAQLISRPLLATVGVLEQVAGGDLTSRLEVDTRDEIGKMAAALNRATEAMRTTLMEVRMSADSMSSSAQGLASSSGQLAAATEQLASGAQEQASSLEETSATMEQITSTVKQNADSAKQASQVANGSRDTAEKGGQVVTDAVAAMGQINESSKNIAEIISAIDEIAFQTNLLALNAAVEAARAGEQGRGFAVVATEVRNLAQRSATSAKEIKRLIQDSVRKVENGSELVNKSGETLREIVGSVKRVTDIVAEITAASQEQSVGVEQVNKAMMQMDQVTQNNSSQTEELSATAQNLSSMAQSLSSQAQQLQGLVGRFRVDNNGARPSFIPSQPAVAAQPAPAAQHPKPAVKPVARQAAAAAAASSARAPSPKPGGQDQGDSDAFESF